MTASSSSEAFTGFPPAAFEFYEDLEEDNSKTFWAARKEQYDRAVRAPMTALTDALREEFGPVKIFRPYRDVRFARDKTPYKTHQGAYVATAPGTGWYAEIAAPGFRTGGGFYRADAEGLKRLRGRIAGPQGERLAAIVRALDKNGWAVGGEQLKTVPRGFETDHPRIDLLRHKSLSVSRVVDEQLVLSGRLLERVRADWRELRPLVDWLTETLGR